MVVDQLLGREKGSPGETYREPQLLHNWPSAALLSRRLSPLQLTVKIFLDFMFFSGWDLFNGPFNYCVSCWQPVKINEHCLRPLSRSIWFRFYRCWTVNGVFRSCPDETSYSAISFLWTYKMIAGATFLERFFCSQPPAVRQLWIKANTITCKVSRASMSRHRSRFGIMLWFTVFIDCWN